MEITGGIPDKFRGRYGKCPNCLAKIFLDHCEIKEKKYPVREETEQGDAADKSIPPVVYDFTIPERDVSFIIGLAGVFTAIAVGIISALTVFRHLRSINNADNSAIAFFAILVFILSSVATYVPFLAWSTIIKLLGYILFELRRK